MDIKTDKENSVCAEAHTLVHGDRDEDYGHPFTDYERVATIYKALTGIDLTPYEAALVMVCVKLSRQMNKSKRDNYVDLCGYVEVLRMVDKVSTEKGIPLRRNGKL